MRNRWEFSRAGRSLITVGAEHVDTAHAGLLHIDPASDSRGELHLHPPFLLPQIHVGCRAMRAAAAGTVGPFRKRNIEFRVIPSVEPDCGKSLAAKGVSGDQISLLQAVSRKIAVEADHTGPESNDDSVQTLYRLALLDLSDGVPVILPRIEHSHRYLRSPLAVSAALEGTRFPVVIRKTGGGQILTGSKGYRKSKQASKRASDHTRSLPEPRNRRKTGTSKLNRWRPPRRGNSVCCFGL